MRIKMGYETHVYVSDGYLCVSQTDPSGDEDGDDVVMLTAEQAELAVAEMQRLLAEKDNWCNMRDSGAS